MKKWIRYLHLVIIGLMFFKVNAAEITMSEGYIYSSTMYIPTIIFIKGEISNRDYAKFFRLFVRSFNYKVPLEEVVILKSDGGDLNEAIEIGKLINKFYLRVKVIEDCYSACSFIALSAKYRFFVGKIGLHRPYFEQTYFAGLSAGEAETEYRKMSEEVRKFLIEQDVSTEVIDKMFSTSSTDIWLLDNTEAGQILGQMKPSFHEWVKAQCPSRDALEDGVDVDIQCLNKVIGKAREKSLKTWLENSPNN